ncbi:hypothetical protein K469DRAFT_695044 [Zopfia rhizophila CBS 207.26]|uniref:Uncharacterized protein n=1 Tax=Zopfia rhizophila CBS 207.26 TaxID=1314779 RepID=A0A6A6DHX6_9PEZI|nr:hypothetical protein K469DRAFT_695044 [Zopfia rhizophila CBS 207.26]
MTDTGKSSKGAFLTIVTHFSPPSGNCDENMGSTTSSFNLAHSPQENRPGTPFPGDIFDTHYSPESPQSPSSESTIFTPVTPSPHDVSRFTGNIHLHIPTTSTEYVTERELAWMHSNNEEVTPIDESPIEPPMSHISTESICWELARRNHGECSDCRVADERCSKAKEIFTALMSFIHVLDEKALKSVASAVEYLRDIGSDGEPRFKLSVNNPWGLAGSEEEAGSSFTH